MNPYIPVLLNITHCLVLKSLMGHDPGLLSLMNTRILPSVPQWILHKGEREIAVSISSGILSLLKTLLNFFFFLETSHLAYCGQSRLEWEEGQREMGKCDK